MIQEGLNSAFKTKTLNQYAQLCRKMSIYIHLGKTTTSVVCREYICYTQRSYQQACKKDRRWIQKTKTAIKELASQINSEKYERQSTEFETQDKVTTIDSILNTRGTCPKMEVTTLILYASGPWTVRISLTAQIKGEERSFEKYPLQLSPD